MQTNNLIADFFFTHISTLAVLFYSYCMNVYGSQVWSYKDFRAVEKYTVRNINVRRNWRTEHNIYLLILLIIVYQLIYN